MIICIYISESKPTIYLWYVNVEYELLQVSYLFLVSISLSSSSSLEKYKYFLLSWYTSIVLGKWIQISSFAFFSDPWIILLLYLCVLWQFWNKYCLNQKPTRISNDQHGNNMIWWACNRFINSIQCQISTGLSTTTCFWAAISCMLTISCSLGLLIITKKIKKFF